MASFASLWLPVLVGAVVVFFASFVIHMLLPLHKGDYRQLPNEDAVLADLRKAGVEPGMYFFPHLCGPAEMKNPEAVKRFEAGPVGTMVVQPNGMPRLGRSLVQWFVYCVLVGAFVAYLVSHVLPRGADFALVMQVTGGIAFFGYAGASAQYSIWWNHSWRVTAKNLLDGLVYGVLTGLAFGWLWPR